ncbi:MAG: GTPase [archaeon]
MPTKKQLRSEKKLKNQTKQKKKYPLLLKKIVSISDIILEVLDARFIKETRNKSIEKEAKKQDKKIIYVLNKSDLIKYKKIPKNLIPHIFVSCKSRTGIKELRDKIKLISKKIENPVSEKINVGVIGYPNTGKSSLINTLVGKSSAGTGADAGFTKGIQKLKLTPEIMLIDTPGVIPEEDYSGTEKNALAKHAEVSGRSYSQVKEPEIIISKLMEKYGNLLDKHYKINSEGDSEILIEKLGRKKGFLKKGGDVNEDKTSRFILKEWQKGIIKV